MVEKFLVLTTHFQLCWMCKNGKTLSLSNTSTLNSMHHSVSPPCSERERILPASFFRLNIESVGPHCLFFHCVFTPTWSFTSGHYPFSSTLATTPSPSLLIFRPPVTVSHCHSQFTVVIPQLTLLILRIPLRHECIRVKLPLLMVPSSIRAILDESPDPFVTFFRTGKLSRFREKAFFVYSQRLG